MEDKQGFLLAIPDEPVHHQTTYTPSFLGLHPESGPWPGAGFGEGVVIAVIDTGILPTHASFADDGTMPPPSPRWHGRCDFGVGECNNKLVGAMAFQSGTNPSPIDDSGHGTHTASTTAGSPVSNASVLGQAVGVATGIAPRAHIAMYKVLFGGSGRMTDVIAGIDQAIADGADVLSMSLGSSPRELYQNGLITASFAAMSQGIFPSAAAANSGPNLGSVTNDAPWMLTVAASTTDRRIKVALILDDGVDTAIDGESAYQPHAAGIPFTPVVYPNGDGDCSTSALARFNVSGKVVVCSASDVVTIGTNVKNAGGAAMVILGPVIWGLFTSADANMLPAVYLNSLGAEVLLGYVKSGNLSDGAKVAFWFRGTQFGEPKSPSIAAFSSRGPSGYNGGILKPDVAGPGVNILGAWPNPIGPDPSTNPPHRRFNLLSGTSMSTPHLAGIAAILKKLHPEWSAAAVKSAIVTTAYPAYPTGAPMADQYPDDGPSASNFAKGAGHVDPTKAAEPGLVYDAGVEDYVGYMCGGLGYTDEQVSAVVQSKVSCSTVKRISAEQLNYPSISLTLAVGSEKVVWRTATNVGEANSVYTVRYVEPGYVVGMEVSPRRLKFSKPGEKKSFSVRFSLKTGVASTAREVVEGELVWVKGELTVRSPIVVTLTS
ncbi:hypothetical protein HPP92_025747 [Vanilla planifolia]|uniref:Uncharacterized protein n=1 Tax=Vanilla planifolia TaxID=51239 RepID=A0A835PNC8_VANPL|nr:hypothetical protein HPP92_025747 [Vanilla planifolia]